MVYVVCDVLSYGALFQLIYLDHRRALQLMRRVAFAEFERARNEQQATDARASFSEIYDFARQIVDRDTLQCLDTLSRESGVYRSEKGWQLLLDECMRNSGSIRSMALSCRTRQRRHRVSVTLS